MKIGASFAVALALVLSACSSKGPTPTITQSGDLGMTVQYVPDPPAPGIETITIGVHDAANRPVEGAKVELYTTVGAMNMNGKSVAASPKGNGLYSAAVEVGAAARWLFTITAKAGSQTGIAHIAVDVR